MLVTCVPQDEKVEGPVSFLSLLALNQEQMPYLVCGCIGGFLMGACWPIFSVFFGQVMDVSPQGGI